MTTHTLRAPSPQRAYVVQTLAWMGLYAVLHLLVMAGLFDRVIGTPAAWWLALLAALPIAAQLRATIRLMKASDEYQRAVIAKGFIVSAGVAMAICSAWGFGETYAGAPHVPVWCVVPLFWAVYGLVAPFVRSSR